jgi:hypothetical protein
MVFSEQETKPENPFHEAFEKLSKEDKKRVRNIIKAACGISDTTFYEWLHDPSKIVSHNDKLHICDVLNIDIKILFPKKKQ